MKQLIVIAGLIFAMACKTLSNQGSAVKDYQTPYLGEVRVNWYTTRQPGPFDPSTGSTFSDQISSLPAQKGVSSFNIAPSYQVGALNIGRPPIVADDVRFNEELNRAAYDPTFASRAVIFVHGFNHTLENAMSSGAEIFAALERPANGVPPFRSKSIVFSWPSAGKSVDDPDVSEWLRTGSPFYARAYERDAQMAVANSRELVNLLGMVCGNPQPLYRNINIVAHSLGARLSVEALASLSRYYQGFFPYGTSPAEIKARIPCRVHNLMLASGDMGLFRFRDLLPDLLLITDRITLYVNGTVLQGALNPNVTADLPLALSKLHNFFSKMELGPRIGHQTFFLNSLGTAVEIVTMKFVDSAPGTLGHQNIFSSPSVLTDINYTMNDLLNPYRRRTKVNVYELP
jgi:esterase/lipase superfamily enzyme